MMKVNLSPSFFFMETKVNARKMEKIRRNLGYNNGIDVPFVGSRGGLSLGWKDDAIVDLQGYCDCAMDLLISNSEVDFNWRFTGFYGAPNDRRRAESWDLLRRFEQNYNGPWIVIGDFNEIVSNHGKRGRLKEDRQMR